MAKFGILLALLFVGGFAFPTEIEDVAGFDDEMSIFFDHTVSDIQGRIVGGTMAGEGAIPWMVAMTIGVLSRSFLCGGSIINQRSVLTAAHCIAGAMSGSQLNRNTRVTVGTNVWNRGGQTHQLQRHAIHPNYNAATIKNDIGILTTTNNIVIITGVAPVPLAWDNVGANVPCMVSGWGRIRAGGPLSNNLLELDTATIDGQRCANDVVAASQQLNIRAPPVDPNVEICTFIASGRGTCNGDSGSALVRIADGKQIGIVSWGFPCARGAPDMFVRVSAFRSWITQHT